MKGHIWTVVPTIKGRISPPLAPPSMPFQAELVLGEEPLDGLEGARIPIRARLSENPDGDELVVMIHGLGGTADSIYMIKAAAGFYARGFSVLRISMRGATGDGADIYNGGLTEEIHMLLADPRLAEYSAIHLVGFSLGGHIALRAATETLPERVKTATAVCSPLDLEASARAIDAPTRKVYREYVLRTLRTSYLRVIQRGRHVTPWPRVKKVRSIREYDALVVVPRFGFADVNDYYQQQSVAGRLGELKIPALYLGSTKDPMIPKRAVAHVTEKAHDGLDVRWVDEGGHVYFPEDIDAGLGPEKGLVGQIYGWMGRFAP